VCGGTPQLCAANAINGNLYDLVHTGAGVPSSQYIWGMWDTGSTTTSIDRYLHEWLQHLLLWGALWHRDANIEVAAANDSEQELPTICVKLLHAYTGHCTAAVTLANGAATPSSAQCVLNLAREEHGSSMGTGLVTPNWYGADCSKFVV